MSPASAQSYSGNRVGGLTRSGLTLLLWGLMFQAAAAETPRSDRWRLKAQEFEKRGAWLEACRCYEEVLRKDRLNPTARDGYQRCLRRLQMTARHADPRHRQMLNRLSQTEALEAYERVLFVLTSAHPDRSRTNLTALFEQGLHELRLALDEPLFRQHFLSGVKPAAINAFKHRLATTELKRITSWKDGANQAWGVIRKAPLDGVPLRPPIISAFVMEFAAGACASLDEHSAFLSPGHYAVVQEALRGKVAGIGVEVGVVDDKGDRVLQITRVYQESPACGELAKGERVLRIAGQPVADLPAEAVAERLRGDPGSTVEVEVEGHAGKRTVKLVRQMVNTYSVEKELLSLADGTLVGYIRILSFQDSTLGAVQEALAEMMSNSVKGLILDLRGNPGGLFNSALAVAENFLTDGIIVIGQSPAKEFNQPFKAESRNAISLPMVVLIDGETASAAEVLAGALKEVRAGRFPTRLLGQTSYGKGTVQCVFTLEKTSLDKVAGIRLTVAKLLSPSSQPYNGRGITPHVTIPANEDVLAEARKQLLQLIYPAMTAPVMPPMPPPMPLPTRPMLASSGGAS